MTQRSFSGKAYTMSTTQGSAIDLRIVDEPASGLEALARIPIAFQVDRVYDVAANATSHGYVLTERRLSHPFVKDYDAIPGNAPADWLKRLDVSSWRLFWAFEDGVQVGGALVAPSAHERGSLPLHEDLALLWDLRVAPTARGHGVGSALLRAVVDWASAQGFKEVRIETQDINVPACRMYARHGFVLREVNRAVYPAFPREAQLLWYKTLEQI